MPTNEPSVPSNLDPAQPIYQCHDCGAKEGELHNYFPICDQEMCPICVNQLLSCKHAQNPEPVVKVGRLPFIHFPVLCARCGAVDPDFFDAPDRQWRIVVPKPYWHVVLCMACFDHIAKLQVEAGTLEVRMPRRSKRPVDDQTIALLLP
jgi:hypothetical protein